MLLPGTAFVELAVRAGDQAGCGRVEELTLEAPLVLPAEGAVQVQVMVGGPDEDGRGRWRCTLGPGGMRTGRRGRGMPAGCWPRAAEPDAGAGG